MLAPLFALLRKDRPWIVVFAVAGLLTALGGVLFADPVHLLLLEPWAAQAAFWIALGAGLLLGAFAGLFDELLGTRELLWQRPVAAKQLAASRVAAVALVLLVWQLAIPLALAVWWPFASAQGLELALGSWPQQQAAVAVAWPCAMAMLFAATLPLAWLPRLLAAATGSYVALLVIGQLARLLGGHESWVYFGLCVVVAATFAGLVVMSPARRQDPDRPIAGNLPVATRCAFVGFCSLGAALVATEWEAQWIHGLYSHYPSPGQLGRSVVLLGPVESGGQQHIVDGDYQYVAYADRAVRSLAWPGRLPWPPRDNEIQQPRWIRSTRRDGNWMFGHVRLGWDGLAWWERRSGTRGWSFERLAVDGDVRFSRSAAVMAERAFRPHGIVVAEPGVGQIWRLDAPARRLVAVPLPAGDRVVGLVRETLRQAGLDEASMTQWAEKLAAAAASRDGGKQDPEPDRANPELVCVRGERGSYVLVGDTLHEFPLRPLEESPSPRVPDDPVSFRRSLPASEKHDAFVHDYRPRTSSQRWSVAFAMSCSSLRPPVLQVVAQFASPSAPGWLCDPLVVDGRRTWLVVAQLTFAGLLAWRVRRWLQRHGVPATAWAWQIALFGLPAFLLFVYFERPRRVVAREVTPPAAPRITDASSLVAAN